ncbi:hypothetical protein BDD12DRAFT_860559, partial [Trichophaea hybrida]
PFTLYPTSLPNHQTRHLLSSHLSSLASQPRITSASGSTDEFTRFLDLELGRYAGVRRQYLTALRENAQACREHAAAVAALHAEENTTDSDEDEEQAEEDTAWKDDYLKTLQIRKQLNRLSVLREGVAALANSAAEHDLATAYTHPAPDIPDELTTAGRKTEAQEKVGVDDELVLQLEKKIVAASEEVFREVSQRREGGGRVRALEAVHTELMGWLEKALSVPEAAETVVKKRQTTGEEVVQGTDAAYSAYLDSRTELLKLLAARDENPPPLPDEDEELAEETRDLLQHHRLDVTPPLPAPQVLRVLAAAEHLLPLSHTQKSLMAAQNQHSSAVSGRRAKGADVFTDGGGVSVEDPVSAARGVGETAVRAMAMAEKAAEGHVASAKEQLEEAKKVADEVEVLCCGEKKKRAIPVRGGGEGGGEEGQKGVWAGLGGGVGVIGDGI